MRKPFGLKLSCYTDRLVGLNEYLDLFHRGKLTQKIGVAELNEILCNSMSNSCIKQEYVKVFDWEPITFKRDVNIFEHMDIAESIYKGVVEHYYLKN